MSSSAETDAEDVNDFLKRIQELGTKRDQEDEERNRKLEEEILQGRKERQARRAERARSISPTKDSPVNTPTAAERLERSRATISPPPDLHHSTQSLTRNKVIDDTMENLTGERSPTREDDRNLSDSHRGITETNSQNPNSSKVSASTAIAPSRNSPLSWQRRPTSQASDRPRSRPLSMIATENAARSPRATPEPSTPGEEHTTASRDQISQMLGSKDPSWFRQTSDRGENSPAYRKNQVEDSNVVDVVSSSRMQLPGMARDVAKQADKETYNKTDINRSISPSRNNSSTNSTSRTVFSGAPLGSSSMSSTVPLTSAQRLDPPSDSFLDDEKSPSERALAMSPSQGRISPERGDRPSSPTKGMGGFVQSAMMKRSDSVNKRWSVQSPPGLSRGNSVASNRSIVDTVSSLSAGGKLGREPRPSSLSRDNSPLPLSRPTSSHSNATAVPDSERPGTSSSMTGSTANDGFVKPALPHSRSQIRSSTKEDGADPIKENHSENTPPSSPSKAMDARRWSPTKSSWLESALNKPDLPKPKVTPVAPLQPAWMAEISKAKERNSVESSGNVPIHKHEVNIGGLLRSPPPGGPVKQQSIRGIPADFSPRSSTTKTSSSGSISDTIAKSKSPIPASANLRGETSGDVENTPSAPSTPVASVLNSKKTSASGKVKPETPPKKDFRSNLKPRQLPSEDDSKQEPEFKNVFGQLRRTKTQNYVAPDELKDNILRGKAGLNVTGGPKKTERKDELKEAILKKKEDFKKAQLEGTGVTRSISSNSQKVSSPLPEALAKKATLGRSGTAPSRDQPSASDLTLPVPIPSKEDAADDVLMSALHKEISAPGRMQGREAAGGKLADRFNPALANLLARGPPSAASDTSRTSSPVMSHRTVSTSTRATDVDTPDSGPQLTHMTKARARGPRRKAPSSLTTDNQPSKVSVVSEPDKPSDMPFKALAPTEKPSSKLATKSAMASPLLQQELDNDALPPTSPHKLDIKRRSRFLEEVSNKNEKALQQLDTPKPLSPTKKANIAELPASKQGPESAVTERKVTPSTKPKPSSLTSPVSRGEQTPAQTYRQKSPEIADRPSPILSSKSIAAPQLGSPSVGMKRPQQSKAGQEIESVISVKNSAALFSRQPTEKTGPSTGVKEPIKLPTHEDEKIAMIGAGLMSPDSDSSGNQRLRGLGIQGLQKSTVTSEKPSSTPKPQSLQETRSTADSADVNLKPHPLTASKTSKSPPPTTGAKPMSPKKMTNQAVPQSSEASKLLVDFFGKNDFVQNFNIDTAAILSGKLEDPPKIKSLRSQLFQLSGDGKKQQVPTHQERILFENNMYLCPHTFGTLAGKKVVEVYFWAGDGVPESSIEDAELFALREARAGGGTLVKLRQGKETSEFIEALGGIMIIRRGSSNKYDSLAPHILCGRRFAGQIVFDEVDFSPSSLCSGFPYLISTQSGQTYLWKGKGSGVDELSCARLIGMDSGLTGEMAEIDDSQEPASFLAIFGSDARIPKSADHWRLKPAYPKYSARLFRADLAAPSQISEVRPVTQSALMSVAAQSQIHILDAFFEIYILVGPGAQAQYASFCTALVFAQEYAILAASIEDRPFVPVSTVVFEGVPRDLKAVFRKWKEGVVGFARTGVGMGLQRGKSLRVVTLSAALDATRF